MTRGLARTSVVLLLTSACTSSSGTSTPDARADARPDAMRDGSTHPTDAAHDAERDGAVGDTGADAPIPTRGLLRLANWSPDAPGLDLCVAVHGTSDWTGPLFAGTLGAVTVLDAGLPFDAGAAAVDASVDSGADAGLDGANDAGDAGVDATGATDAGIDAGPPDGSASDGSEAGTPDAGPMVGVLFPGFSPYVSLAPGAYDVRVIAANAADCSAALIPDTVDLPVVSAGTTETLALVGDANEQGSDSPAALVAFQDDTSASSSNAAMRFINAVPSVIDVTFAAGTIPTATIAPYLSSVQFGGAGVDTDAGALDSNDYLSIPAITGAVWSLINANGGIATLVSVEGGAIPAGKLTTVAAVGGESGPDENDIGILVCTDTPPIVAGETASCVLYVAYDDPVCPECP